MFGNPNAAKSTDSPDNVRRNHATVLGHQMSASANGRSIEELVKSNDRLSGVEAQRLRSYFTSNYMIPSRDFDVYGKMLLAGNLDAIREHFQAQTQLLTADGVAPEAARTEVAKKLAAIRYGPTKAPIFNCLLLLIQLVPHNRDLYMALARWYIDTVHLPVDEADLSGSSALMHSISTKPAFEPEFAQLLFDGGANVNMRNRYGATLVAEVLMIWEFKAEGTVQRAADALQWFLCHGGDLDIADGDGMAPRTMLQTSLRVSPHAHLLKSVLDREESKRKARIGKMDCCQSCGEKERKLLSCQKAHWQRHKAHCKT
ncbi:hypothetical protein FISHEDRAFT_57191 [Fistulina hepatica ATCC 64428]|nr:hypothetical protein FISHEDRAFT_57191 [Fistulina hepatica ATCC 64428]